VPEFTASDLTAGRTYRVRKAFVDFDGTEHPVGETWRFLISSFVPYHDGLTLKVEINGTEKVFRFEWRSESQGDLIDRFSDFVEEV
jgi:hypothetical protein